MTQPLPKRASPKTAPDGSALSLYQGAGDGPGRPKGGRWSKDRSWRAWYGTQRWKALRRAQLKREPLCWLCADRGRVKPATICNHKERHNGDPLKFWNGPFNSMCKDCHDTDQQRIENGGVIRQTLDDDGWPI